MYNKVGISMKLCKSMNHKLGTLSSKWAPLDTQEYVDYIIKIAYYNLVWMPIHGDSESCEWK
jgi:hypothetical protein